MNSAAVIAVLREHESELRRQGVTHAALFGSVARGDAGPDSDLDIMVQIDPAADVNLYDYVGITQFIGDLFAGRADVSDREMLIEPIRREAEREAIFAF
ncbi:nucleotidyltransferase family protein [Brevundimonas sp. PWP3-1b1]|uniref:nucleotidyltransferase family protein n=1 Tax=unclassified Brevundimonas TaxID=2622653 RepID=UPI003CEF355D